MLRSVYNFGYETPARRARAIRRCRDALNGGRQLYFDSGDTLALVDPRECAAGFAAGRRIARAHSHAQAVADLLRNQYCSGSRCPY